MAFYNTKKIYNAGAKKGIGANYNSAPYMVKLYLTENFHITDAIKNILAFYSLKESFKLGDSILSFANYAFDESFSLSDDVKLNVLHQVTERLGISDIIANLLVSAFLTEDIKILDKIDGITRTLSEDINLVETIDLKSFYQLFDKVFIKDEIDYPQATHEIYDTINVTDKTPRKSVSDFYISLNNERTFNVLKPFNMMLDKRNSSINFMPEAVDTRVSLPSIDGDLVQDTVYKNRLFELVTYSEQGLTTVEKQQLMTKIANTIHTIKSTHKKLTIGESNISFDVKYSGIATADDTQGSYVKMTLPLQTITPYGYNQFEHELDGNGLLINNGIKAVGFTIEFKGEIDTIINVSVGSKAITWSPKGRNVAINEKLVIDSESKTCYIINENGIKTNAMIGLTGKFAQIPIDGTAITCYSGHENKMSCKWRERFIWGNTNDICSE